MAISVAAFPRLRFWAGSVEQLRGGGLLHQGLLLYSSCMSAPASSFPAASNKARQGSKTTATTPSFPSKSGTAARQQGLGKTPTKVGVVATNDQEETFLHSSLPCTKTRGSLLPPHSLRFGLYLEFEATLFLRYINRTSAFNLSF